MIKITKLTLKNFLSVGNVTQALDLSNDGLTLVLGHNNDGNNGVTRNGAGKSTLLQAISFALYGKPLTQIKLDNLTNNINNKGLVVSIEFERDGKPYRVERGRKPAFLKFYANDHEQSVGDDESQGENKHTQEEIEKIIGMSHVLFKHLVALNTFTEPFLRMKPTEQRGVIEELLGITQISQRAEALKEQVSLTKERLKEQEAITKTIADTNARIETAIKQAEVSDAAWQKAKERRLVELDEEIEAVAAIDYAAEIAVFDAADAYDRESSDLARALHDAERDLDRVRKEAKNARAEVDRLSRDSAGSVAATKQRLLDEIARKERDVKLHNDQVVSFRAELTEIEDHLSSPVTDTCHACGQEITGTDHHAAILEKLKEQANNIRAKITHQESQAADRLAEIDPIRSEIVQVEQQAEQAAKDTEALRSEREEEATVLESEADRLDGVVTDAKTALAALGTRPAGLFTSRDEVYAAKQLRDTLVRDREREEASISPHAEQISALKGTLQEIDWNPLNELTDLQKHQDFLYKLLTGKDSFIRKRIMDQNLTYLNGRLNHYLDKLGLPHEVRFMSDLSVEISLLGRDFDFEQLSRGEMNRVIMAVSWAFRDVWESMNTSINLLWVDELIDNGLDDHGAEAALEVLKKMSRERSKNVFLISHKEALTSRVNRILTVHKEGGFTRIETDAVAA